MSERDSHLSMISKLLPRENIDTYCFIFVIETALRELIIETFSSLHGPTWYKKRLPSDILEKYKKGFMAEKNIAWSQLIPYHPIYYIDFPDLKKIIERENNWRDAFQAKFGSRKDILCGDLSALESIRNKIAHNRKVSGKDLSIVKGVHAKLLESLGEECFEKLSSRCTAALNIYEQLHQMQLESDRLFNIALNCQLVVDYPSWKTIGKQWWFDELYLGNDIKNIVKFYEIMEKYERLPRVRGCGYSIEAWVKDQNVIKVHTMARKEFEALLISWRK